MTVYANKADIPADSYIVPAIDLRRGSVILGWLASSEGDVSSDLTGTVDEVGPPRPGERIEVTVDGWTDDVPAGVGFVVADQP